MTLSPAEEANFDGKYLEAQAHDTGKFHEILRRLELLNSAFELPVGLLADTMHKSESYPLQCLAEFWVIANSMKWIKQEQGHKPMTAIFPENTGNLNPVNQIDSVSWDKPLHSWIERATKIPDNQDFFGT